jgi:hypothetical protein
MYFIRKKYRAVGYRLAKREPGEEPAPCVAAAGVTLRLSKPWPGEAPGKIIVICIYYLDKEKARLLITPFKSALKM